MLSWAEVAVAGHFLLLGAMWLTRDPRFVKGWASFYGSKEK